MVHTKRISSGYGKKHKWVATQRPGGHPKKQSIPLVIVVRDILGHADTAREAKKIISDGLIFVDKKPRKDHKYPVGLMDVVGIPKVGKHFRVLPSKKGLVLKEISEKESNIKLCKIINKSTIRDGKIQLSLHDGSTLVVEKNKYKTNDTIVLDLSERKLKDSIEFKKGNIAIVVRGRHSGEVGKIKEILESTVARKSSTTVGNLQTLTEYIFVIGKEKSFISI